MRKYEVIFIVKPMEEEATNAVISKFTKLITENGGTIDKEDRWGKKRLAYEIQKMREGFYYFVQFDAEPTVPLEIENRVRIMDNVLRYLCVKAEA